MFSLFYPDSYEDSAYGIDYEGFYASGIRGLIYDIDNTLVMHGAPADQRAVALFQRLHAVGFRTLILSNNKERRVKPKRLGYLKSMEIMGTKRDNTVLIGDQLFTDILGANRCGIRSILVQPIHPKEEVHIILKRILEKPILFFYKRKEKIIK